jgi:hypothetical protein
VPSINARQPTIEIHILNEKPTFFNFRAKRVQKCGEFAVKVLTNEV